MAKRKTTSRKAPARRAAAAPKRRSYRKKSGTTMIPAAAATVGAVVAMKEPIKQVINNMSVQGVKSAAQQAVQVDTLKKTAIYTAGAYVAGEAIKRYAPKIIKTPAGKIAKKIPKFF
jgi:hypothetical protein